MSNNQGPVVVEDSDAPHLPVEPGTNRKHSWQQFRECGMLWLVNRTLHLFGWAIVLSFDDKTDELVDVYPVRTEWRGFGRESNERGYLRITTWMAAAGAAIAEETKGDRGGKPEDWNALIAAALAKANKLKAHVPFTWENVTVEVHPGDKPMDVRMRWRTEAKL